MIILKHLTIERFRLLRSMNLHFPQRGSILIQGQNEAGKSAFIESIYFALYGECFATSRGKRPLDDLILYGSSQANVTLTLSVGTTDLVIGRTIERGRGQQVTLQVRRLGLPDEDYITDLPTANARIIAELGRMNADALRNACLLEQKGLNRLETVSGVEREATVRKLLGLERFSELAEQFQVGPQDEQLLQESTERLRLAEIQTRIPQLSEKLHEVESALDAVSVCDSLAEIQLQEREITELEETLEELLARRLQLKSKQARIQQIKKADKTLSEIISSYDEIAEARNLIPQLESEIAELELREREELPKLERRVAELADLTRSFGTLQRMSNDLLTAIDSLKNLETQAHKYNEVKQDLAALDEQISEARSRLQSAQQSLREWEERRQTVLPQLEARLQRLNILAERLQALKQLEEQYVRHASSKSQAEESSVKLTTVQRDLREAEQELALLEREAYQAQQRAQDLENIWRHITARRLIEEWVRLKSLLQDLTQVEQKLQVARQEQSRLTQANLETKAVARRYMLYCVGSVFIVIICAISIPILILSSIPLLPILLGLVVLAALGGAAYTFVTYSKLQKGVHEALEREQEAISQVGSMVAARETASRMSSQDQEALLRLENEMRSLNIPFPQSLDEAQQFLQRPQPQSDPAQIQQQLKEKREAASTAYNRVNVTREAIASLHKERARLAEIGQQEQWYSLEEGLRNAQAAIERMQQEIVLLAGQDNFPLSSVTARIQASPVPPTHSFTSGSFLPISDGEDLVDVPDLQSLVESTIKALKGEITSLSSRLDVITDLTSQVKIHQEAINVLLSRKKAVEDQHLPTMVNDPNVQLEHAREQQSTLRNALQSLQDSLRQRVKPLGVTFGQAAISQAELLARKQLEELQITLGNKIMLQEKHSHYTQVLRNSQESLSEHYKQLAKFSNTLGSWIVPLNPFAEALIGLRNRCQRELEEANEERVLRDLTSLEQQEAASNAKIALCQEDIITAQSFITDLLAQRGRPEAKSSDRQNIEAVWPLVGQYKVEDRSRLEDERVSLEDELHTLEQQELELSNRLTTGSAKLDLEEMRSQMEVQDRSYQTKKRGGEMIRVVNERLLSKMLPRTEYYMQQILPLLTGGRYHDVHLEAEPEDGAIGGGPYQIQVWDSGAGEYVQKAALSGGAADQLSLALRLAFAISVLPRELSAAPGFVILDEPLSSFDRGRARSLVDVVTGDILSQHFEQIILVSHSSAFDPAMFPYHIYMDNGLVVESNLPVVPTFALEAPQGVTEALVPVPVGLSNKEES
jgi:DNA repair exonuclease SbcCD ATPase subunit